MTAALTRNCSPTIPIVANADVQLKITVSGSARRSIAETLMKNRSTNLTSVAHTVG
jgi:hypothetical protein